MLSSIEVFFLSHWLRLRWRPALTSPLLGADWIGEAVAEGTAAGFGGIAPSCEARRHGQRARDEAFINGAPGSAIGVLASLIRNYPSDEVLQRIGARILGEVGETARAIRAWEGILGRFPSSREAFIGLATAVARRCGPTAAGVLVSARSPGDPSNFDSLVAVARAWDAIGDTKRANAASQWLTALFADRDEAWCAAASRLEALGSYRQAASVLRRAAAASPRSHRHRQRLTEIDNIIARLPAALSQGPRSRRQCRSLAVLGGLLSDLVAARNEVAPAIQRVPGSVVMIIGGLGPGGAEQQLVHTARGLAALPGDVQRPAFDRVAVVAESCRSRKADGFFRPQLQRAGVPVIEYEQLPLFGGRFATSAVRSAVQALRFLPTPMLQGVLRLSDALRQWRPEVVQIWQEATVFDVGLAALLARVPRIILSLRSVPAIDRPERYRPEYPILFNALMAARNVDVSCNSRFAAGRYSEWLGIDPARITILPNGVERLPHDGDDASEALFREFEARTGRSRPTVGVVMRMDENKRPLLWVETAAGLLERLPSARFILVGDGRLRRQAARWIEQRGIADRFLFVGASRNVGFWLAKMDLFMLLSKHEGLPNALIEAQLSGVPAVTTPAGGAAEAIVPGVSGVVTAPDPSAEEIAAQVVDLLKGPDRLRQMGEAGARWAASAFSITKMLQGTLALMAGR